MLARIADLLGLLLRAVFRLILLVRRPRPIHTRGHVLDGEITWMPGAALSGIPWIDEPPATPVPVVARLSRGVGLPAPLPDLIGLAMRIVVDGRPADVELASTGIGVPGRFLLVPHRFPFRAWFGSLLPYRSERGPVLLAARAVGGGSFPSGGDALDAALARAGCRLRMYHATPAGKWHPFAEVSLRLSASQDDRGLRFDSFRHTIPGAGTYAWARSLRQPSYRLAQRE